MVLPTDSAVLYHLKERLALGCNNCRTPSVRGHYYAHKNNNNIIFKNYLRKGNFPKCLTEALDQIFVTGHC